VEITRMLAIRRSLGKFGFQDKDILPSEQKSTKESTKKSAIHLSLAERQLVAAARMDYESTEQRRKYITDQLKDNIDIYEDDDFDEDAGDDGTGTDDVEKDEMQDTLRSRSGEKSRSVIRRHPPRIRRALFSEDRVLLLDEIVSALDSATANAVLEKIVLLAGKNKTILAISHQVQGMPVFEKYFTRRVVLHKGQVVEDYRISS
jgi:ABC-type glutathione transport system ATPase component